jgi:hypothetical protein
VDAGIRGRKRLKEGLTQMDTAQEQAILDWRPRAEINSIGSHRPIKSRPATLPLSHTVGRLAQQRVLKVYQIKDCMNYA